MSVAAGGDLRQRLVGGSVQGMLAEGLALPTGVLVAAFLSRRLGPDGYGLFALAASLAGTIEWFVIALLSRATVKQLADSTEWRGATVAVMRRYLAAGIGLGAALWMGAGWLAAVLGEPALAQPIRLFSLQVPLVCLASGAVNALVGRGRFGPRATSRAVRWLAQLLFIVVFVSMGMGVRGAILGSVVAALASWVIAQAALGVSPFERSARLPGFWRLALGLFTVAVSIRLLDKIGLVALKSLGAGMAEAGYYAAAQNFALAPGLFAFSVAPVLLAIIGEARRHPDRGASQGVSRDALRSVCWLLPPAGFAAGASTEMIELVYGSEFAPAAPLAQFLVFGGVAVAGLSVTAAILAAFDRARWAVVATAPVLPIALAGYIVLIPRWGAAAAAAVTSGAAAIGLAASIAAVHRAVGALPTQATLWRAALVTALAWAAAAAWPAPGVLLLIKAVVIGAAALAALVVLGEFTRSELMAFRALVPGLSRGPRRHHLSSPIGSPYLDPVLAAHKHRANLGLIERWTRPDPSARVLKTDLFDEAMGTEGFLDHLAPRRLLVGIDVSPGIAGAARRRLDSARVGAVVADVRRLPFAAGAFDLVISNSTLDHFDSQREIDLALAELAAVTKPGGVVIVTLDNPYNLGYPLLWVASVLRLTPFPLGKTCNLRQLTARLERAGLDVTDTTAIIHNPRLVPTGLLALARWLRLPALQRGTHRLQAWFGRFEGTRWQYLTGCFIAARAVKPGGAAGARRADVARC